MMEPQTTAVIVSYRARDLIERTMETMHRSHQAGLLDCVVVDNASGDGTVEYLESRHSWARVVRSPHNVGFGRGCNLGAEQVDTPYLLLLNPDADLEPEVLQTLVKYLDAHPSAGMAAPAIVDYGGELQAAGDLPTPWSVVRSAWGTVRQSPIEPGGAPFQVDWLCGAVLLIRTSLWKELDGFDPRFFLYFEETDLCRRAAQKGAELWAVGAAIARHVDGGIARRTGEALFAGCIAKHYFESRSYYLVKHHGWIQAILAELGELLILSVRAVPRWLRGRSNMHWLARLHAPLLRLPAEVQ